MPTSASNQTEQVAAARVHFEGDMLIVSLTDGREVSIPLRGVDWLKWLADANAEQRAKWSLEPGGFAVYWEPLDDGFEVRRLLDLEPIAMPSFKQATGASAEQDCVCCQNEIPKERPRICPLCGHCFKGNGWDGIDAHWRACHENVMSYVAFWDSLCRDHRA